MRVTQYRKKKKYRTIFISVIALLGIAVLAAVVYLLFYTHKIEVKGTTYSDAQVIQKEIQKDKLSVNTLYLLWKYKYGNAEMLPYIEDIKCSLKAPWSVKVSVTEKKIIGTILVNGQYVYFDKEGLILQMSEQLTEGITVVEGLEVTEPQLYKTLDVSDRKVFENIVAVAKALKKSELTPDRIVCSGADINLYIGNVCVQLGTENYEEKIAQIAPVLEKLNGEGGTLHLEHFGQGSKTISFIKGDIFAAAEPQPEGEQAGADEQGTAEDQNEEEQNYSGEDNGSLDDENWDEDDSGTSQEEDQNQDEE